MGFNRAYETFFGVTREQLIGKTIFDTNPHELAELYRAKDIELFESGGVQEYEAQVKNIHGELCDVIFNKAVFTNNQGTISGLIGTILDITERKRVEEALKESEYFFRESQRAAAIGSYKADFTDGTWESSRILDEIFGIEEAYPRNVQGWVNLIHPDDQAMMDRYLREEVIAGKTPFSKEYRIIRQKDGETRWVFGLGEVKFDGAGNTLSMIGTIQDITERKWAEEEKAILEAQLQQAHKMEGLGILVAGVSHNFNNILAIIMGTASFREQGVIDPLDRKAYETISKACRRGRDVVKSLMQFARPTLSIQAPFELHALIKEVCVLLKNTTSNRIKIIEAFVEEPLWVKGDAGPISHCFVNLCINSIDAMPDGGNLMIRTTIPEEDWVEVSVEDDGEGMTPDAMAHALEPFFTTKEVGRGTGLGLSMTYGVIKAHGGIMEIDSAPESGTIVRIRLPRIPAPFQEETAWVPPSSLVPMNILFVDDEEDVRFLMKRMLKKAGVSQVKTVPGGKEALECLCNGETPDLVILDQNMPGINGVQTLAQIRGLRPDLPILISSGQPDIHEWACFQQPNVAVISKPFDMEEIKAKLAEFAMKPKIGP
jgi:PAS domain S-box-containing protein